MSKVNTWQGTARSLGKLGQKISVQLTNGKVVQARLAWENLNNKVIVIQDAKGNYHAYPTNSQNRQPEISDTTQIFHKKRLPPKPQSGKVDYVVLYRVKSKGVPKDLVCVSYDGADACKPIGASGYPSYHECVEDHPVRCQVGYFYRGYLDYLGAPGYQHGFPYELKTDSLCVTEFMQQKQLPAGPSPTGAPLYSFEDPIVYVLPQPALPGKRVVVTNWKHSTFRGLEGPLAEDLQSWNDNYHLAFKSLSPSSSDNAGESSSNYNDSWGSDPWTYSIAVLKGAGYPPCMPDYPSPYCVEKNPYVKDGVRTVYSWVSLPRWRWRILRVYHLTINNVFYYHPAQGSALTSWNVQNVYAERKGSGYNPELIVKRLETPAAPFMIAFREYYSNETTPTPPAPPTSGSSWTLFCDTKQCVVVPPNPNPLIDLDGNPTEEYPNYDYFVQVNGGTPRKITTLNIGESIEAYISITPGGTYYGSLKIGQDDNNHVEKMGETLPYIGGPYTVLKNGDDLVGDSDWCKIITFSSNELPENEYYQEYDHKKSIITNLNDWQSFRSQNWTTDYQVSGNFPAFGEINSWWPTTYIDNENLVKHHINRVSTGVTQYLAFKAGNLYNNQIFELNTYPRVTESVEAELTIYDYVETKQDDNTPEYSLTRTEWRKETVTLQPIDSTIDELTDDNFAQVLAVAAVYSD